MLSIGALLQDRYRILKVLNEGGMSVVYLGDDTVLKTRVAIKEMKESPTATPQERQNHVEQFLREAQLVAGLEHAGLPRVSNFFCDRDRHYLVMDYIAGMSAEALLERDGPFSEAQVRDLTRQIARVLHYLHHHEPVIIFRDLKPSNIIITEVGRIKLIDFGISKDIETPDSHTRTVIRGAGTPGYAPPEQYGVRSKVHTDARSDVYSLGATMYSLLTAKIPEEATDRWMNEVPLTPPRAYNPAISVETEVMLLRMLALRSEDRPQSMLEVLQWLDPPGASVVGEPEEHMRLFKVDKPTRSAMAERRPSRPGMRAPEQSRDHSPTRFAAHDPHPTEMRHAPAVDAPAAAASPVRALAPPTIVQAPRPGQSPVVIEAPAAPAPAPATAAAPPANPSAVGPGATVPPTMPPFTPSALDPPTVQSKRPRGAAPARRGNRWVAPLVGLGLIAVAAYGFTSGAVSPWWVTGSTPSPAASPASASVSPQASVSVQASASVAAQASASVSATATSPASPAASASPSAVAVVSGTPSGSPSPATNAATPFALEGRRGTRYDITSRPAGAHVIFDHVAVGTAPMAIVAAPGSHHLVLKHGGYVSYRRELDVNADTPAEVPLDVALEPTAGVVFKLDPPDATVRFEHDVRAGQGEVHFDDIKPGKHHFTVAAHGYVPRTVDVQVSDAETVVYNVSLQLRQGPLGDSPPPRHTWHGSTWHGSTGSAETSGGSHHVSHPQASRVPDVEATVR